MHFGLFMMPLHPPHRTFADSYRRDIDQIVLADKLGFREAFVGEHLTERWENAPAPDLLIAQALALTKTIKLGTGVTLFGLDAKNQAEVRERSAEVLEVVLALWASDGVFRHHGKFFDIETPAFDPV